MNATGISRETTKEEADSSLLTNTLCSSPGNLHGTSPTLYLWVVWFDSQHQDSGIKQIQYGYQTECSLNSFSQSEGLKISNPKRSTSTFRFCNFSLQYQYIAKQTSNENIHDLCERYNNLLFLANRQQQKTLDNNHEMA